MKILKISYLYFSLVIFLASCGNSNTEAEKSELKSDPGTYRKITVSDCIKRILYIEYQLDVNKYDSLSTHYFHELKDYVDSDAISMKRQLDSITKVIHRYRDSNQDPSLLYHIADSLKTELSPYPKHVIGYAFVHTYFDGNDTSSAIFVMDTMCGFGEMTVVKDKIIVDPIEDDSYTDKIKSGSK